MNKIVNIYKKSNDECEKNIALSKIIGECENTIKYFCMKYSNIMMDSDDIRAELLVVVLDTLEKFNDDLNCEYKTYFSRGCESKCNQLYRDLSRQKRAIKNDDGEILHSISYEGLLDDGIDITSMESSYNDYSDVEVKMLLDSLDLADEEKLICEKFVEGFKRKEIADMLEVSPAMLTYKVKKIRYKFQLSY